MNPFDLERNITGNSVLLPHDVAPAPRVDCDDCCYELRARDALGGNAPPLSVQPGESLQAFTFLVPWPEGEEIISLEPIFDSAVSAHVRLLSTRVDAEEILRDQTGSYIGMPTRMVMSSPRGSGHLPLPDDTSLTVDRRGLLLEVLYHNALGVRTEDASGYRICTGAPRMRSASLGLLGTENLLGVAGLPEGDYSLRSICEPREQQGPIEVLAVLPHMHQLGTQMRQIVRRADAPNEEAWVAPFSFGSSNWRETGIELMPGDSLTTECTFSNNTGRMVAYGISLSFEQCYAMALATPARSLENGVVSLIGVENTCWGFGQ